MAKSIRRPVVSGSFYSGNRKELESELNQLLNNADRVEHKGRIRMIIVPHAGYVYSGSIAACAYKQVMGGDYRSIVIIGPSHRAGFDGAVVDADRIWQTPIGESIIDDTAVQKLVTAEKRIRINSALFDEEHSLEVQLPFLQKTLPDCKIVPIMVGSQDWQNCELLGNAIAHTFRSEEILIIASSDLYHGYSYKECVATDQFTIQAIEKFEPRQLARALHENKAQACGGGAIVAGQWAAAQLGGKRVVTLKYANSNDITNTREGYVVGYVAAMILNPSSYEK